MEMEVLANLSTFAILHKMFIYYMYISGPDYGSEAASIDIPQVSIYWFIWVWCVSWYFLQGPEAIISLISLLVRHYNMCIILFRRSIATVH